MQPTSAARCSCWTTAGSGAATAITPHSATGSRTPAPSLTASPRWSQRHTRAYYRVLDALRREFPQITIEGCSGGGGRIDAEVLARSDVVWTSDETGPRDRLRIQHGFLTAFPAAVNSSWVTHLDGHLDTRPVSPTYRACVSMCGVLGLGMELTALSTAERDELRELVAIAKDIRPLVLDGEAHRHGEPDEHGYAVEFAQVEGECTAPGGVTDPRDALIVFGAPGQDRPVRLRPRFVGSDSHPRVQVSTAGSARWDGADLLVELDADVQAAGVLLSP